MAREDLSDVYSVATGAKPVVVSSLERPIIEPDRRIDTSRLGMMTYKQAVGLADQVNSLLLSLGREISNINNHPFISFDRKWENMDHLILVDHTAVEIERLLKPTEEKFGGPMVSKLLQAVAPHLGLTCYRDIPKPMPRAA